MRIRLFVALAALAWTVPAAAQTVERFEIKGAQDVIIIPKDWNGSVFIYAHGYTADKRLLAPLPDDLNKSDLLFLPAVVSLNGSDPFFLPAGYASAFTTFRSVGWYVKDAIKDIENLRRHFVQKYGQPKHTYLWGHSGGGMVTEAVIEYFPDTYEGASPQCGPGAGARRNFDGAYDLRVLYDYVCGDVPGTQFLCGVCTDGSTRCLQDGDCAAGQTCGGPEQPAPAEQGLTAACTDFLLDHPDRFSESASSQGGAFVSDPVTRCFGDLSVGGTGTAEQLARRDLYLRASQIPENFVTTDLFFASIGLAEVVHHRTGGKPPWGNDGTTYASQRLTAGEQAAVNAGVHRSTADAGAVRYMSRFYEPRGRTKSKVVTVHALDDGLVIPENEDKYREAFEAAGRADQLVQLFTTTGGHCGFAGQFKPALEGLVAWVEHGQKPDTSLVNQSCGNCLSLDTPGSWGLKVVERKQRGEPVRKLVCTGEPGDCPAHSTCATHRKHCR